MKNFIRFPGVHETPRNEFICVRNTGIATKYRPPQDKMALSPIWPATPKGRSRYVYMFRGAKMYMYWFDQTVTKEQAIEMMPALEASLLLALALGSES